MADVDQLASVMEDLIAVLQTQAQEWEKLIAHVEQVTTRLPEAHDLAVVRSELAELRVRAKRLRAGQDVRR